MSWACGAGNTRSTTLAAEKEAAAAGNQIDNATLINILMGKMTVPTNPSPAAADVSWPDEEHVALARHATENPFLVIPHPKNADHPLCVECGIFAASTLVVPAPGSIPEWPARKGMFPYTHCRSCATADDKNEYVFGPVNCGCGVSRQPQKSKCFECYKEVNESKICITEGCGEMRSGNNVHCKPCRNLSSCCLRPRTSSFGRRRRRRQLPAEFLFDSLHPASRLDPAAPTTFQAVITRIIPSVRC